MTADLLLDHLRGVSVFRLNFDQILSYEIRIDRHGYSITDPTGRTANHESITKAYWRKPMNADPDDSVIWSQYVAAEMRYAFTELVNLLWSDQKIVLVEPYAERRTGKLLQLRRAEGFFSVPDYYFTLGYEPAASVAVVKSLSSELVDDKILYTTKVRTEELDSRFPWFIESVVDANFDITVVYVRGQLFCFSLVRDFLDKSVDWRRFIGLEQRWHPHSLPEHMEDRINKYMSGLKLDYGRLDFLLDRAGCYWFCEVNPNGQFAWLDVEGSQGLLNAVIVEISPETTVFPIPNKHPLYPRCSSLSQ